MADPLEMKLVALLANKRAWIATKIYGGNCASKKSTD